jgi:hypothetical protein
VSAVSAAADTARTSARARKREMAMKNPSVVGR